MDNKNLNNGNKPNGQNGSNGQPPKKQSLLVLLFASLLTLVCISYFMKVMTGGTSKEITYNEFYQMVENETVEKVFITKEQITIYPKKQQTNMEDTLFVQPELTYYTGTVEDPNLTQIGRAHV